MEKVKQFLNDCEDELRNLKNNRREKANLNLIYSKLRNLEAKIKQAEKTDENREILRDIDSLLFIVSSMLDYYNEESSEK